MTFSIFITYDKCYSMIYWKTNTAYAFYCTQLVHIFKIKRCTTKFQYKFYRFVDLFSFVHKTNPIMKKNR